MKRQFALVFIGIFLLINTLYADTTSSTPSGVNNTVLQAFPPSSNAPNQTAPYDRDNSAISSDAQQKPFSEADVSNFAQALEIIRKNYVEDIPDQKLFDDAIRGVLNGLDPHSSYLDADDLKSLNDMTSGEFTGIGIEVVPDSGYIKVVSPIDGSPAQKAGLQTGDIIIRINGVLVKDMTLNDAVKMMRGKAGTPVTLTLVRKGQSQPLHMTLVRDFIKVASVTGKLIDHDYGYIRISLFQADTGSDLATVINHLNAQANGHLRGVVLDLRDNPGGLLDAAVAVVNDFLDADKLGSNKLIVFTKSRVSDSHLVINATSTDMLKGVPMVVLINGGSASASEIVAGALQDHKRALVVGTKSFGKGSVQTVIPLGNDAAIKLTTALYFTPSGRSIQAEGITPDVMVENLNVTKKDSDADTLDNYSEADLKGHLANANAPVPAAPQGGIIPAIDNDIVANLATKDYQLYEAVNLLKGMAVLQLHNGN